MGLRVIVVQDTAGSHSSWRKAKVSSRGEWWSQVVVGCVKFRWARGWVHRLDLVRVGRRHGRCDSEIVEG